jgi:DNA-binding transcriptional ArsR family regulator
MSPKITLDREAFKALASDTRLEILRILDGKKMSLSEISRSTNLNKATLHEHLSKLNQAGLVKRKEREGHKWVYYKLSWKGESLLHPENTKIVVMFTFAFIALWAGIIQMFNYAKGTVANNDVFSRSYDAFSPQEIGGVNMNETVLDETLNISKTVSENTWLLDDSNNIQLIYQNPIFLYIAIACFICFTVLLVVSIWRLWENKNPKL